MDAFVGKILFANANAIVFFYRPPCDILDRASYRLADNPIRG